MKRRTKIIIGLVITTVVGVIVLSILAVAGIVVMLFGNDDDKKTDDCLNPGINADVAPPAATGSVGQQQIANAKAIANTVEKAGFGGAAALVTLTVAFGESSLLNQGQGDSAGPDSRGLYQQRATWGTEEQRMNPSYSTLSFLLGPKHDGKPHGPGGTGLLAIPGWQNMTPSEAIHKVQVNADPNHYTPYVAQAQQIAAKAGVDLDQPATNPSVAAAGQADGGGDQTAGDDAGDCGGADPEIGTGPCPLDGKSAPGKKNPANCNKAVTYMADQVKHPTENWRRMCLHLVMTAYGWSSGPATARQAAQIVINAHQMHHDTSKIPAGAVLWWDGSKTGNTAGHVAIADGKGYIYSNDVTGPGKVGRVPWTFPVKSWGQTFLGWSAPYFPQSGR